MVLRGLKAKNFRIHLSQIKNRRDGFVSFDIYINYKVIEFGWIFKKSIIPLYKATRCLFVSLLDCGLSPPERPGPI